MKVRYAGAWSILWVLAAAQGAGAATYTVNNQSPAANDANPGTATLPFKTISAAARRVHPGDTVEVDPGVYREAVTLTVSGRDGAPITFKSTQPGQAIIDGADVLTDWASDAPGIWSIPSQFPKVAYSFGNGQWVYLNGEPMERAEKREDLKPGYFFQDFAAKRLLVALPAGQDIKNQTVEFATREGLIFPADKLDDIHIEGFTLKHNADWFRGKSALTISGRRWVVENNHILWGSYWGLQTRSSADAVIRHNIIEWCGNTGIGGRSSIHMIVEDNQVRYNNWRRLDWGNEGGGSKWILSVDCTIRGNDFSYNYGPGIWLDIADAGFLIENNICHDNLIHGIMLEIGWQHIVQNNLCFNNGGNGLYDSSSPEILAQHNVIFNNGFGIFIPASYTRKMGDTLDRNTAKFRESLAACPDITPLRLDQLTAQFMIYWAAPAYHTNNNCYFVDNLLFDNGCDYSEWRNYGKLSPVAPFINNFSDSNIFWGPSESRSITYNEGVENGKIGEYGSLAEWQKASGRDTHSIWADPRAADTKIPEWAAASRPIWSQHYQSCAAVHTSAPGVMESATSAILFGRLFRSSVVKPVQLSNPRLHGVILELDNQKVLALWASKREEQSSIRMKLGASQVVIEDGYLAKTPASLSDGTLTLQVGILPTFIYGIGADISEEVAAAR